MAHSRFLMTAALLAGCWALTPASTQAAAEGTVSGPTMGFFFDAQLGGLRPILGVPGAAQIGAGLALNGPLSRAQVAPGQQYALGVDADGSLVFVDLRVSPPQSRALPVGLENVSRILISPLGEAAAVYDRGARRVQFFTGMLASPSSGSVVALTGLQGVLTAMAVGDQGQTLLAATSSAEGQGGLYVVESGGEVRRVSAVGRVLSMTFLPGQDNALLADYERSEVLRVDGVRSVAVANVIAAARDGVRRPLAIQASADRRHAVAALDGSGRLALIPLSGGAAQFVDCNCRPRELTPMRGKSLYRLTSDPNQPLFVLDAGRMSADGATMDPRVVFVPAQQTGQSPAPVQPRPVRPRSAR